MFKHILVALDGSSLAEAALSPTANLSTALLAPLPGTLHLVRVLPLIETDAMTRAGKTQVTRRLPGSEGAASPLQVHSSVALDTIDIAGALVRMAASLEEDEEANALIALATHRRVGWERLIAGRVTERVLAATRAPVLVVHPPQSARTGKTSPAMSQEALPR